MSNDCVIIPKSELEKLEQSRVALFDLVGEQCNDPIFLSDLMNITRQMWLLSHKRWPSVENQHDTTDKLTP